MNKRLLFISLAFLFSFAALAQIDTPNIVVHKDSRIDILLKKQANINKTAAMKTSNGQYKGYRIMVLNTNDRELAYKTKGQILTNFPDQQVYMSYQAPFFKLKVGDFLKRADAEDLRKDLGRLMPKGVFIISDVIKLKPEEEAKLLGADDVN